MKRVAELLREFRVLQVAITTFLSVCLWLILQYFLQIPFSELSDWQLAAIAPIAPSLIAGLFKVIELIQRPVTKDE